MNKEKILIVDDDNSLREFLSIFLHREGYQVSAAANGEMAIKLLSKSIFDMVITDVKMPSMSGLDLLKEIKERSPDTVVVMITAYASVDTAVEAMKQGAYDYISKPFNVDEIKLIIRKALEKKELQEENTILKRDFKDRYNFNNIISKSSKMQEIYQLVTTVASTRSNIFISGESGTGKELIARAIHNEGPWKEGPFVAVNCGAIPDNLLESELFGHQRGSFTGAVSDKKGLFEVAHGGTLFLDEISELAHHLQVKFLRAIQERSFRRVGGTEDIKVDVRLICATNSDIEKEVKEERFREDLYYRLKVIPIVIPPLRERREDIPLIAKHFLKKYSEEMKKELKDFSPEAMAFLLQYPYPGNVRELENIVEGSVALESSDIIAMESLPYNYLKDSEFALSVGEISGEGVDLEKIVADTEMKLIAHALKEAGGVKKKAAEFLNISLRSLRYLIGKYDTG